MRTRRQKLGNKNLIGKNVEQIRKRNGIKQWELLVKLQVTGVDINPSSLSKLEGQTRPVTDIELVALADILEVPIETLLQKN